MKHFELLRVERGVVMRIGKDEIIIPKKSDDFFQESPEVGVRACTPCRCCRRG